MITGNVVCFETNTRSALNELMAMWLYLDKMIKMKSDAAVFH